MDGKSPGEDRSSEDQRQEKESFWLCDLSRGMQLNNQLTLRQNGVCSGHRLMLI